MPSDDEYRKTADDALPEGNQWVEQLGAARTRGEQLAADNVAAHQETALLMEAQDKAEVILAEAEQKAEGVLLEAKRVAAEVLLEAQDTAADLLLEAETWAREHSVDMPEAERLARSKSSAVRLRELQGHAAEVVAGNDRAAAEVLLSAQTEAREILLAARALILDGAADSITEP